VPAALPLLDADALTGKGSAQSHFFDDNLLREQLRAPTTVVIFTAYSTSR